MERRIDEVNDLAVRLDRHLPILESVIESQNAGLRSGAREGSEVRAELGQLREGLTRTQSQIATLREDLAMAALPASSAATPEASPVVRHLREQLGRHKGDLRLTFGFGRQQAPGRVAVDLRELRNDGIAAGLRSLPFSEGSAAEVRADFALEAFSVKELRQVVLPYLHWLLRPRGTLVVVGVDAEANLSDYRAGKLGLEELAGLSLGVQHEPQNEPQNEPALPRRSMLSEALLKQLLETAGFITQDTVVRSSVEGGGNQMEVRAKRGATAAPPVEVPSRVSVST